MKFLSIYVLLLYLVIGGMILKDAWIYESKKIIMICLFIIPVIILSFSVALS